MDTIKKYFLVLTALKESLPKNDDENLLYLGEWCLPKGNDTEVIPYIFNSGTKMNSAYIKCDEIYERMLIKLVPILNNIHDITYDYKAYEIILGNWLKIYIHQLFEKYSNIKYAFDNYNIVNMNLLKQGDYYIPLEFSDYMQLITEDDEYNLHQYSQIIHSLGYTFSRSSFKSKLQQKSFYIEKTSRRLHLLECIFKCVNKLFKPKVTVTAPYFGSNSLKNYVKLFMSNVGFYNFDSFSKNINFNWQINKKIRDNIILEGRDEFEEILCKNLPYNIPLLFIEGFLDMKKESEYFEKNKTAIYYTSNALHSNNLYKFFLAKNHTSLIITSHQHGGGYGLFKNLFSEKYERSIANKFYTWGWKDECASYLPHKKLSYSDNYKQNDRRTIILIPLSGFSRYLHRFQEQYFSSLCLNYQNNILSFLNQLSSDLENKVLIRNHIKDYGWNTDSKIIDKYQNVEFDDINSCFNSTLENSKVVVSLHLTTTYLEALVRNIPTLIYIDKAIYEFREETQELIDNLFENNIVFYDIKLLVFHLNSTYNNIERWWRSKEVQRARKEFCYQYARGSINWVDAWGKEFQSILNNINQFQEQSIKQMEKSN